MTSYLKNTNEALVSDNALKIYVLRITTDRSTYVKVGHTTRSLYDRVREIARDCGSGTQTEVVYAKVIGDKYSSKSLGTSIEKKVKNEFHKNHVRFSVRYPTESYAIAAANDIVSFIHNYEPKCNKIMKELEKVAWDRRLEESYMQEALAKCSLL